jgi:hypothetical protein
MQLRECKPFRFLRHSEYIIRLLLTNQSRGISVFILLCKIRRGIILWSDIWCFPSSDHDNRPFNVSNRVHILLPSPEEGNSSSFRNVVFYSYLEFQTMDKDQKPRHSDDCTPSSGPFRKYRVFLLLKRVLPVAISVLWGLKQNTRRLWNAWIGETISSTHFVAAV